MIFSRVKSYKCQLIEFTVGTLFLICGCAIYLLFRSRTIRLYQWCEYCGLGKDINAYRAALANWTLPDFFLYSLPDGLYCASYILIMRSIWHVRPSFWHNLVIIIIPLIAILHELMQFLGFVPGTFTVSDLICYIIPVALHMLSWYKVRVMTEP